MDFAPYQDDNPEIERLKSPPPRGSIDRVRSPPIRGHNARAISDTQSLPHPSAFANDILPATSPPIASNLEERGYSLQAFQTSLPLRLDYEAMLAYILLPPAGGVLLLILEHKSDYVRFHAWQSSMLFTVIFLLHLALAWNKFLSWTLFAIDLLLIGFLAMHAYRDVENLDHYEVPFFGRLANSFVDDE